MSRYNPFFTIMVLDESFNVLDEIVMPKNTYEMNTFFVDSNGLNISTNHYYSKSLDENNLKFHTLKLMKK